MLRLTRQWISVKDKLPPNAKPVLCSMKSTYNDSTAQFVGNYARKFELEAGEDDFDKWLEYNEEADEYFYPEGWYEQQINWGDYASIGVCEGDVTHWMALPERP